MTMRHDVAHVVTQYRSGPGEPWQDCNSGAPDQADFLLDTMRQIAPEQEWRVVHREADVVVVEDLRYDDDRFRLTGRLSDGTRVGLLAIDDEESGDG